jgi:hypothetical protein
LRIIGRTQLILRQPQHRAGAAHDLLRG